MRRKKMNYRKSKRNFRRNAVRVNGKNNYHPMRGGIRL